MGAGLLSEETRTWAEDILEEITYAHDGKTCKEVKCRHHDGRPPKTLVAWLNTLRNVVSPKRMVVRHNRSWTWNSNPCAFDLFRKKSRRSLRKDFISNLEPAFELPSNRTFRLFVTRTQETKAEVFDVLRRSHFLNVSLDESSNIKRDRIINICILTNFGLFCLRYELVGLEHYQLNVSLNG
jgi:hypothetical protein